MEKEISYLEGVFLAIVQSLTEFLPVSSTAHLRLLGEWDGMEDPGTAVSAVIQLGSWLALLCYFRKDLLTMLYDSYSAIQSRNFHSSGLRLLLYLGIGTLPISLAGLALGEEIRGPWRALPYLALALIIVGIFLYVAEALGKQNRNWEDICFYDALWLGLAQSLALVPGASRSGTTLAIAMFLGLKRAVALRFSFLLSIPAIGLAGFYELIKESEQLENLGWGPIGLSIFLTFIFSYLCIHFFLAFVRNHKITIFVIYRIVLGLFILWYSMKV